MVLWPSMPQKNFWQKAPLCKGGSARQGGGGLYQPLRQKSKMIATSPYTGEAFTAARKMPRIEKTRGNYVYFLFLL